MSPKRKKTVPERKLTPAQVQQKHRMKERQAKAVEMRARGATIPMIAQALGYNSQAHAARDLQRAYAAVLAPNVEAMRQEAYEKLQHMYAQIAVPVGSRRTDKNGKSIPRTVEDEKLDVQRVEAARKLLADVRELYSLDAPPPPVRVQAAVLNLSLEDMERMTTADIDYVLEHGRLPPQLSPAPSGEETH